MPRSVNALRGLAGGVMSGSPFGLPGQVIGGAVGLFSGILSPTDEEQRTARINELVQTYERMKKEELAALDEATKKGVGRITKYSAAQKASSRAGIARRAGASGRTGDNEAYILSAEGKIGEQSSGSLDALSAMAETSRAGIEGKYNSAIAQAKYEGAAAPLEPTGLDLLEAIAGPAMNFTQNQDYMKTLQLLSGSTSGKEFKLPPLTELTYKPKMVSPNTTPFGKR